MNKRPLRINNGLSHYFGKLYQNRKVDLFQSIIIWQQNDIVIEFLYCMKVLNCSSKSNL